MLLGITGLIMYGFYGQCDPRLNGDIQRTDQVIMTPVAPFTNMV